MNTLSWLIYFAGVSDNLATAFGFAAGIIGFGCIVTVIYGGSVKDSGRIGNEVWERGNAIQKKALKIAAITIPIAILLSAVLPNRDTVLAIAASEMGEQIATNPRVVQTTNKAFDALDKWLDNQIAPPAPAKETK